MSIPALYEKLYFEPWLITETLHRAFGAQFQAYIGGLACDPFEFAPRAIEEGIDASGIETVAIQGPTGKRLSPMERAFGGKDYDDIHGKLSASATSANTRGVLLHIDSPGGMCIGCEETAAAIAALSAVKPVGVFTDCVMASAAYWMGSQANFIFASPSANVGSIGVYSAILDKSRMYEMAGVEMQVIKAGKFKGAGIPGTSLTEAQRTQLQDHVNATHENFKSWVRRKRGNVSSDVMEGQVFSAPEAAKVGLIDAVGSLADAKNYLLKRI